MQEIRTNIQIDSFLNGGGSTLTAYRSKVYTTSFYKVNSHQTGEKAALHKSVAFFVVPTESYLKLTRKIIKNSKYYGKNKTI